LGLKDEWTDVIRVLRDVIPVYDKVNNAISLGKAQEYRLLGIKHAINNYDKGNNFTYLILDAGSGYGNMSSSILSMYDGISIVMLDPIIDMLRLADVRFKNSNGKSKSRIALISGVFEHLPFKDSTFNAVICGYSFRDAIIMRDAIREFSRVLRDDGRLVIVDIGKPDNLLARFGVYLYLRFILPLIALIVAGRLGLKFSKIYDTYKRLPRNSELVLMLKEYFPEVTLINNMLGAAVVFVASKEGMKR
jgi:demethylmenaquinone methyltransferase/2-methoxy-6-polyprenyl-1,4-benzoquinol methylase